MSFKFDGQLQNPWETRLLILQYAPDFKSISTKRWEFLDSQYSIILREINTATIEDETQKSTTILKDHLLSLQKERKNLEAQKLSRWKIDKELSMAQDKCNFLKPPSQQDEAQKFSTCEINEQSRKGRRNTRKSINPVRRQIVSIRKVKERKAQDTKID
jgi:hypothetical protein